ncbi:MAG: hypothetical protein QM619_03720 [Micropruina sp.]|uniref:hypothetical protein n=1 Tax=Micropruina sp. TaxID=2737536 RepID=UPI0039E59343
MSWPAPTGEPVGPDGAAPRRAMSVPDAPPSGPGNPDQTQPYPALGSPAAPDAAWPAPDAGLVSASDPGGSMVPVPGAQPLPPTPGQVPALVPQPSAVPLARLSQRTGQPVRPWTVWTSAVLLFGGAVPVVAGLLLAMWQMASPWVEVGPDDWNKIDKFNAATWLTAEFPSEPASGMRVLFAILCCLIAVLVAGVASTVGYYAFSGYRWTRIGALVAVAVSSLSLLLTPIAAISIGVIALGAVPLWLPASTRFFARWQLLRHPQIVYSEPIDQVFYGPLPRYRGI